MRKKLFVLLCAGLFACMASCACAQTVSCPEAHLSFNVPDSWRPVPLEGKADPGLCLLLESEGLSLSVYVDDAGGFLPDAFQILTGGDTESKSVTYGGVKMTCVAGTGSEGDYRIYTWVDEQDQVQFYFLITGTARSARGLIEDIMGSIEFD